MATNPYSFEAYNGNEPYIFLSYSHLDSERIKKSIEYLHNLGYRIWFDGGIHASDDYFAIIERRISGCTAFMAFTSEHYFDSELCEREMKFAIEIKAQKNKLKHMMLINLENAQNAFEGYSFIGSGVEKIDATGQDILSIPNIITKRVEEAEITQCLSAPVQEATPKFRTHTVKYPNGDQYTGATEKGIRVGEGTYTWAAKNNDGKVSPVSLTAIFVDGLPDGEGTLNYSNQTVFRGRFTSGKLLFGTVFAADGSILKKGNFSESNATVLKFFTEGTLSVEDTPEVIEAPAPESKRSMEAAKTESLKQDTAIATTDVPPNSSVTLEATLLYDNDTISGIQWVNGDVYTGSVSVDMLLPVGHGRFVSGKNGAVYEGDFQDGRFGGNGLYTFGNGNSYEGDFVAGFPSGNGIFTMKNGDVFSGSFTEGRANSSGTYRWATGEQLEGLFHSNLPQGAGTLTYSTGEVFSGNFDKGLANGIGTLSNSKGEIQIKGLFKNGKIASFPVLEVNAEFATLSPNDFCEVAASTIEKNSSVRIESHTADTKDMRAASPVSDAISQLRTAIVGTKSENAEMCLQLLALIENSLNTK